MKINNYLSIGLMLAGTQSLFAYTEVPGSYLNIGSGNTYDNSPSFPLAVIGTGNFVGEPNGGANFIFGHDNSIGDAADVTLTMGMLNTIGENGDYQILVGKQNTGWVNDIMTFGWMNSYSAVGTGGPTLGNSADMAIIIGTNNESLATRNITIGNGLLNDNDYEIVVGRYNDRNLLHPVSGLYPEAPSEFTPGPGQAIGSRRVFTVGTGYDYYDDVLAETVIVRQNGLIVYDDESVAIGKHHDATGQGSDQRLFIVGNGTPAVPANVFGLYGTGEMRLDGYINLMPGSVPASPAAGMIYYDSGANDLLVYDGANWMSLTEQGGGSSAGSTLTTPGGAVEALAVDVDGNVEIKRTVYQLEPDHEGNLIFNNGALISSLGGDGHEDIHGTNIDYIYHDDDLGPDLKGVWRFVSDSSLGGNSGNSMLEAGGITLTGFTGNAYQRMVMKGTGSDYSVTVDDGLALVNHYWNVTPDGGNKYQASNQRAGWMRFSPREGAPSYEPLFGIYDAPIGTANTTITWRSRFFISQDGDVGVGTSAPSAKLDVNGDAKIASTLTVDGDATFKGSIILELDPVTPDPPGDIPMYGAGS